ncbi:hypothetical protein DESC_500003 [Desulfosarcina cetonica]|nr:hypothetical protein DESC_500003 [Desulfosarcina cetonica]
MTVRAAAIRNVHANEFNAFRALGLLFIELRSIYAIFPRKKIT